MTLVNQDVAADNGNDSDCGGSRGDGGGGGDGDGDSDGGSGGGGGGGGGGRGSWVCGSNVGGCCVMGTCEARGRASGWYWWCAV